MIFLMDRALFLMKSNAIDKVGGILRNMINCTLFLPLYLHLGVCINYYSVDQFQMKHTKASKLYAGF